jgi:hypothetical protein
MFGTSVGLLPGVNMRTAQLLDGHAGLDLLQEPDDQLGAGPALRHVRSFLGKRTSLTLDW